MTLPAQFAWLGREPGPKMLVEALKLYGVHEVAGRASSPEILGWADELGALGTPYAKWAAKWYDDDAKAWCGLGMAVVAQRANTDNRPERRPPVKFLSALEWATWGNPSPKAALGDVLVFKREGGGHVGQYVAEDDHRYYVLGFNQGDAVSIVPIEKDRCVAVRRPAYLVTPNTVRTLVIAAGGASSTNEA